MSLRDNLILLREPTSEAAEQFRTVLVNLMRRYPNLRSMLITSCWPGEGKSLITANLAAGMARMGREVILVDGDLRRPALTRLFGQEAHPGLRDYLEGRCGLDGLDVSSELDSVRFVSAGVGSVNPVELLSKHERLADLFDYYRESLVLIDSSPLSVCSDALLLASHVGGALLVVNALKWDGRGELEYVAALEEHGVELLGVVLNSVGPAELRYGLGYGARLVHYYRYYGAGDDGENVSGEKKLLGWRRWLQRRGD